MILIAGSVRRGVFTEIWRGLILGDNLNELESLSTYPEQPDSQQPAGLKMEYNETLNSKVGVRSRAYFVSPANGRHRFGMKCVAKCSFTVKEAEDMTENLLHSSDFHHPNYQK